MSRAFVNEDHAAAQASEPVQRRISEQPNYVTASGLAQLQSRVEALNAERRQLQAQGEQADKQRLADNESDLRYFTARVLSAQQVPTPTSDRQVQIGSRVTFVDEHDHEQQVRLVGEDEADATRGLINWGSPLGQALLGAAPGHEVVWKRPAGDLLIEVIAIDAGESTGNRT